MRRASPSLVFAPSALTVLALGWFAAAAAAQESPPAKAPWDVFAARRAALMEIVGDGIIVLRGAPKQAHMGKFEQDQDFFYLTGIAEPDAAAVLVPATGKQIVFLRPFNRFTATWDGKFLPPTAETAALTKFDEARASNSLHRILGELIGVRTEANETAGDGAAGTVAEGGAADGEAKTIWTILQAAPGVTATPSSASAAATAQRRDRLDRRLSREQALRARLKELFDGVRVEDVTPAIHKLRGIKDAEEIRLITAATQAAVEGIAEAMKSTEVGIYEFQIAAAARYVFSRLGAGPDAYAAIVGAGPNGCVLHYSANSRKTVDGDLIVMDYGGTVHGYCTDVTRTFPANGKFTPAQRKLVEDILDIQNALIAEVKPGASLSTLGNMCSRMLLERGYSPVHGPCHHVGLAVHDLGGDRLEPGMVITVEPGAYLVDEAMGCRIEDTILVTEDGHVNLSGALPRSPDAIEALMREKGIAQVPVGLPKDGASGK